MTGELSEAAQRGAVIFARVEGSREEGVRSRRVGHDVPLEMGQVHQRA